MSTTIHSAIVSAADADYSAAQRRSYAVAVALEIIAAKAGQSGAHLTLLEKEFDRLSAYADQIQAALEAE